MQNSSCRQIQAIVESRAPTSRSPDLFVKFFEVLAGCTVHDTSIKSLSRVLVNILIGLLKAVNVQNIGGGVLEMRKDGEKELALVRDVG